MSRFKLTKESLESAVKNFKESDKTIPFYDSDDPDTCKQIGKVVDLWVEEEDDMFGFQANLDDGRIVKGKTT